jgi:ABC-type multidrug transport system ATPase subunit
MEITLTNLGKRYNRDWIFRHLDYTFSGGKKYAITGPNGSGKSTLLQIIAGAVSHNEGTIEYTINNQSTSSEEIHQQLSLAAPYMELIEEMTAKELLEFHSTFKPLRLPIDEIIATVGLSKAINKQIRYYSSGMKQRLKLAQAFFSETPILCLDEPTTNLDAAGIALYDQLIDQYTNDRMVLISSNDEQEYKCCDEVIKIEAFKKV